MSIKPTELYLIRHGRTDWNALQLLQGNVERELDEEGRSQAQVVAEEFANVPLAAVYSSTMIRAKQTAAIIASNLGLINTPIDGLHECRYGPYEGMSRMEYEQKFIKEIAARKRLPIEHFLCYRIAEGVETPQEIIDRVLPCLKEIEKRHRGEKIAIVCHGGVIRSLVVYFLQKPDLNFFIRNGGHIKLVFDKEAFHVFGYEEALIQ